MLVAIIPSCPQSPAERKAGCGDVQDRTAARVDRTDALACLCTGVCGHQCCQEMGSRCPTSVALLEAREKGVGLRRTGPAAILKIKCIWVKACAFSSQAASLEYLVALDRYSQAPFAERRWNLVQFFCFCFYYYCCFQTKKNFPIDDRKYYGKYLFFSSVSQKLEPLERKECLFELILRVCH